jgi:hypothetical protein
MANRTKPIQSPDAEPEKIAELSAPTEPAFDALSLLTPGAIAGIKPMMRIVRDGLKTFPFISPRQAAFVRELGKFLELLAEQVKASEVSETVETSEVPETGA